MNYLVLIISGVAIGLIVAAPIGPVNLICIRRTLAFGPINGFMAGLGAVLGDGIFAIVTGFGLTAIAQWIEGYSVYLQVGGGILLISFGIHTYLTLPDPKLKEEAKSKASEPNSLMRVGASTFALTITNPATLFGFTALFAGLGGLAGGDATFLETSVVVGGAVAGSTLWWFTLTTVIGLLHAKIDAKVMRVINHASGFAISLFGLAVLAHVIWQVL